ncbi:MAG: D-alanyl-D-alanine carboxypeptidase family protein [Armatimonadaceae bacterium]
MKMTPKHPLPSAAMVAAVLATLLTVASPATAQKKGKVPPTQLPREQAQKLVSAAKIPAFYNPNKLWLPPIISAQSAILVDADTGQVLWEKNADVRRPMASTTKIMTALLLIENTQPDDVITCLDPSVTKIEESSLHIKPWEKFSSQDLLYGFLLRSGNDAGVVIAQHVAGSVPKFAEKMNARAREIGAVNTNFVNPHGLHHKEHYTTARDLSLIAMEAMQNPRFADAVSEPVRTITRSKNQSDTVIKAKVKRYFYDKFPGADGVKTGYTRAAGRCFVGSATRDGRRLMAVVLGSTDSASGDTIPILSWGFRRFPAKVVAQKNEPAATVPVQGGSEASIQAVATEDFHATYDSLGKTLSDTVRTEVDPATVNAPIQQGDIIGKLRVFVGTEELGAVDLAAAESVEKVLLPVAAAGTAWWVFPLVGGGLILGGVVMLGFYYVATSSKSDSRRRNRLPTTR